MNTRLRRVVILVDRKVGLLILSAVVLLGLAGVLASQQLTMSATYPIPAGVYNQVVTTGNSGTSPANTTLNRNAGNTILVPDNTNASGSVGVGTDSPMSYAKLDVNTSGGKAIHTMDASYGGLLLGYRGSTIQARTTSDGNSAALILQASGGPVGIGTASPAAALTVAGGITLGPDPSACTSAYAGTLRYNSSSLQLCNGTAWSAVGGSSYGGYTMKNCYMADSTCSMGFNPSCDAINPYTGACSCLPSTSPSSASLSSCTYGTCGYYKLQTFTCQ